MNRSSPLVRALTALVLCVVLGFLAHRIATNLDQIRAFSWHVRWDRLALSVALQVGVFGAGTFVWRAIVMRFDGTAVPFRTLLRIWSASTLGRYVPGVIWQFTIGIALAHRYQVSPTVLLTSLSVHMGITLAAAAVIAAALAPPLGAAGWPLTLALALALAVFAVHPRVIDGARRLLGRVIRRELPAWRGSYRDGLLFLCVSIASRLVYGSAFWLLVSSLAELPTNTLGDAIGIHAFAFVAGYLAFVVPAGLGVREAALALLLGPYFPAGVAAALAALTRLWTIAAELVTCAVSLVFAPPAEQTAERPDVRPETLRS